MVIDYKILSSGFFADKLELRILNVKKINITTYISL